MNLDTLKITQAQRLTVKTLTVQGYAVVEVSSDVVRMSKNGDNRLIRADGSQLRGQHQVRPRR